MATIWLEMAFAQHQYWLPEKKDSNPENSNTNIRYRLLLFGNCSILQQLVWKTSGNLPTGSGNQNKVNLTVQKCGQP